MVLIWLLLGISIPRGRLSRSLPTSVLLIFGRDDQETPPEMGERLARLIPGAAMITLDGFDHFSILTAGRHQVAFQASKFLKENL